MLPLTPLAQDAFVDPDEYVCVPDGDGGWACDRGRTPELNASPPPAAAPETAGEPSEYAPRRPQERSFPGGPNVQPLPSPVQSEPERLDRSILEPPTEESVVVSAEPSTTAPEVTDEPTAEPEIDAEPSPAPTPVARRPAVEPAATAVEPTPPVRSPEPSATRPATQASNLPWSVQIAALTSMESLSGVLAERGLDADDVDVRSKVRNGQLWYLVFSGRYASSAAATEALEQSPGIGDGWVRRLTGDPVGVGAAETAATPTTAAPEPIAQAAQAAARQAFSALNERAYTLQIASLPSPAGIEELIADAGLDPALVWTLPVTRDGQPWWLVVTGVYSSATDASAAIESLSAELKAAGPWPRRIGDLQRLLIRQ